MVFLKKFHMIKVVWIAVFSSSLGEERHNLMTPNPCHTHIDNLDGKRGTEAVQMWISKREKEVSSRHQISRPIGYTGRP